MEIIFLLIFLILLLNIGFFFIFRFKKGFDYYLKKKNSIKESPFDFSHNIIFEQKKNFNYNKSNELVYYPLRGRIQVPTLSTNNLGFFNGIKGNRNVEKYTINDNKFRINCIGDSTTANYITGKNKQAISYPIILESELNRLKFSKKVEVNNFGQGMYGMQEILTKLIFENIYTKPNLIILYVGYNDIESYLTKNFIEDFSHSKKNLLQSKNIIQISKYLFDFKINFLNYFLNKFTAYNLRYAVSKYIKKGKLDLNQDYNNGLSSFKKNIEIFISICNSNNINVLPCTFCHYLYEEIKTRKKYKKYDEIIKKQNMIIREACLEKKIDFVDFEKIIPNDKQYYLDNIHFSEDGMRLFSYNLKKKIIEILK